MWCFDSVVPNFLLLSFSAFVVSIDTICKEKERNKQKTDFELSVEEESLLFVSILFCCFLLLCWLFLFFLLLWFWIVWRRRCICSFRTRSMAPTGKKPWECTTWMLLSLSSLLFLSPSWSLGPRCVFSTCFLTTFLSFLCCFLFLTYSFFFPCLSTFVFLQILLSSLVVHPFFLLCLLVYSFDFLIIFLFCFWHCLFDRGVPEATATDRQKKASSLVSLRPDLEEDLINVLQSKRKTVILSLGVLDNQLW